MTTYCQLKNPTLAALLNLFISGLGQIYNGQTKRGLIILAVQFVNLLLTSVVIGFFTGAAVRMWAIYDAYRGAQAFGATISKAALAAGEAAPAPSIPVVRQERAAASAQPSQGETAAGRPAPVLATTKYHLAKAKPNKSLNPITRRLP